MWHELCGVRILAMVLVEDILLYSCTFSEKHREGAGLTRKLELVSFQTYRNSMLLVLET